MAREIDRVPIDEVEPNADRYAGFRCGVCGMPWGDHPDDTTCSRYRPDSTPIPDPVVLINSAERNGKS